ncbi:MAG: acetate--CoA ligase family protein [Deltaproteobacteria bacterium]|nr:acetate--CoA ligase family protein [Deltaproteobacteria bacterium]
MREPCRGSWEAALRGLDCDESKTSAEGLIARALSENRSTLRPPEAGDLLRLYGVPTVPEAAARDRFEAAAQAGRLGFPVVLKGLGSKLLHKTERKAVRLGLPDKPAVFEAASAIGAAAGTELEGYLVQPMVAGRREFVAGLLRDRQFGPVVMFGLGGVFAEALRDVTFRIAPIDEAEALRMLDELRSSGLLGPFRGELPVDRRMLACALVGLSRLGLEQPEIAEVDVNPLIAGPDGRPVAVDALVVLGTPPTRRPILEDVSFLDRMLSPRSIAFVGARGRDEEDWQDLFAAIQSFGYRGRLYPVNPRAAEIGKLKAYPDLGSLPERVDLVIIAVSARRVPAVLEECVATGNRNVHIFTAGFRETGEEEGRRLHAEIEVLADWGGLNVIGPNCMGIYNPRVRLATFSPAPAPSGPVAFVSQSGGHAALLATYAEQFGIHFSKVVSYGNALTLDCVDFLRYLGDDPETEIICLYLEGVRDGGTFARLLLEVNRRKPVLLLKGGLTHLGARATLSHTGSLAGEAHLWNALYRQSGAVRVGSIEEITDVLAALLFLDLPAGNRVGVIGTGGGIGVLAADCLAREGLELPALGEESRRDLRAFIPDAGNSTTNPVDAGAAFMHPSALERALRVLGADPLLDVILITLPLDWLFTPHKGESLQKLARYLAGPGRKHTNGKPYAVSYSRVRADLALEAAEEDLRRTLVEGGVPIYPELRRAAFALGRVTEYSAFRRRCG